MGHLITTTRRKQTVGEEIANSLSHGAGFLGVIVAAPFLIRSSHLHGGGLAVIGASIFVVSAACLYLSSLIYHALPHNRSKRVFQLIDHSAIYLLIAGTYTPFTLGILRGAWGQTLLVLIWTLAIGGIAMKLIFGMRFPKLSLGLYLLMGWTIIVAAKPLLALMPLSGLLWISAGGLFYTIGVVFYATESIPYFHFVWHLFVLLGTTCHFVAVYLYAY